MQYSTGYNQKEQDKQNGQAAGWHLACSVQRWNKAGCIECLQQLRRDENFQYAKVRVSEWAS